MTYSVLAVGLMSLMVLFIAGFFSMLGMGGGQLYAPIFYWLGFKLKAEVIPLTLLLNFLTQLSAQATYVRKGLVEYKTAIPLIAGIALFSFAGAYITDLVSDRLILVLLGVLLIIVSIRMLSGWNPGRKELSGAQKMMIGLVAGSVIGILVGMVGHGGGTFVVPMLLIMGLEPKRAAATSSFVVAFSTFSGFLGHLHHAHLGWYLVPMCICVLLGAQMGSRLMALKLSGRAVRLLFGVTLGVIGVLLIVKG